MTPIYDFGYVAMNFAWVYPEDSGEYVVSKYHITNKNLFPKNKRKKGTIPYKNSFQKITKKILLNKILDSQWSQLGVEFNSVMANHFLLQFTLI